MKKRGLFLAVGLLVLMTGCSSQVENTTGNISAQEENTASSNQGEEQEENQVDPEADEQYDPEITVSIDPNYDTLEDNNGTTLCDLVTSYPKVDIAENQTATDLINLYFYQKSEENSELALQYVDLAADERNGLSSEEQESFQQYSISDSFSRNRMDGDVISFVETYEEYTGGAHPNSYGATVNFNTQTGERLTLVDIVEDEDVFKAFVKEEIAAQIQEKGMEAELFEDYENYLGDILTEDTWMLTDMGLSVICNEYIIAPYAMGRMYFTIPYTELTGYLKEAYQPYQEAYAAQVEENVPFSYDIDGDGTMDEIEVGTTYRADEDLSYYFVRINGNQTEGEFACNLCNCFFVKKESGSCALVVSVDYMSDDYTTFVYCLDGGTLALSDSVDALVDAGTVKVDQMTLLSAVDVLGTYEGAKEYSLDDSWKLNTSQDVYELRNGEEYEVITSIKTAQTIQARAAHEDGTRDESGEVQEFPAGTVCYPKWTDGESYMIVQMEDGAYFELDFTRTDVELFLNGVSEYEVFESLPYAG